MNIPDYINKLIHLIQNKGYEAFLVGGAVRDYLLKIKSNDYDLTTNMPYEEILLLCKENKLKSNTNGMKHETVGIVINHNYIEVTCFRGLDKDRLEEDLKLRDFTIDSLAYNGKGIIDVTGGIHDLNKKLIRSYNPSQAFKDDPLRILRMFRFKAKCNFQIEEKTLSTALKYVDRLDEVAVERIHDELNKIMVSNPLVIIDLAKGVILDSLFDHLIKFANYKDFIKYTNMVFNDSLVKHHNLIANYAHLFNIIGIINNDDNLVISQKLMNKFIFSNLQVSRIKRVLKAYNYLYQLDKVSNLYYLISELNLDKDDLGNLFIFNQGLNKFNPEKHRLINSVKNEYLARKKDHKILFINDLAITGDDILKYTKKKSKEVGILKKTIFKMCFFNDSFNNKDKLITFLKTI